MNKEIRKALIAVMSVSCVLSQGVSAQGIADRLRCGHFGLFAEGIYVKPTTGGMDWAVCDQTAPVVTPDPLVGIGLEVINAGALEAGLQSGTIKRRSICPSYNWGFRVGGQFVSESGCNYAQLSGSYVHFQDGSKAAGNLAPVMPFNFDALIVSGTAAPFTVQAGQSSWIVVGTGRSSLSTTYWDIDFRMGQYITRGCGIDIHAWGGFRYVDIDETMTARFGGATLAPTQIAERSLAQIRKREFSGAGPVVGLGGKFCVWGDFYGRGELAGMAVIGSRKAFVKSAAVEGLTDETVLLVPYTQCYRFDNCVNVVPGLETRLAVGYTRQCGCISGNLEIGYTMTHFWNILSGGEASASSNMSATNAAYERDFGVAGPYIGLKLTY